MRAAQINLLPQKDFEDTPVGRLLRWSLTYGRYIIICTEVIVLLAFIYRFSLDRKVTDLEEAIAQKSAIIEANQEFETYFRNLQTRTEQIGTLLENEDVVIGVIRYLESITPLDVELSTITISARDRTLTLNAISGTSSSLALFLSQLKNSDVITQVNVNSLAKQNTGTGETLFSINAVIHPEALTK